jgi:hypothetical protein
MEGSDENRGRSRKLGEEDQGWSIIGRVHGSWMIKRSCDTVCGLHRAQGDEEHMFLSLASKPRSLVSPDLISKPMATILVVWL